MLQGILRSRGATMRIVPDSTVFVADLAILGEELANLLASLRSMVGMLCIPDVVLDEVKNKQREILVEQDVAVRALRRKIRNVSGYVPPPIDVTSEARSSFLAMLDDLLAEPWTSRLAYPEVSHQAVVERELSGRKPFNRAKHTGYRDYLLWLTVLREAAVSEEAIAFVTANAQDFGKEALHADLIADLRAAAVPESRIVFVDSVASFNARFTRTHRELPSIEIASDVVAEVARWLSARLRSCVSDGEIVSVCRPEDDRDGVRVVEVSIKRIEDHSGVRHPWNEVQVRCNVECIVHLESLEGAHRSTAELSLGMAMLTTSEGRVLRAIARRVEGEHGCHACSQTVWDSRGMYRHFDADDLNEVK